MFALSSLTVNLILFIVADTAKVGLSLKETRFLTNDLHRNKICGSSVRFFN